jgi:hypothetical protein
VKLAQEKLAELRKARRTGVGPRLDARAAGRKEPQAVRMMERLQLELEPTEPIDVVRLISIRRYVLSGAGRRDRSQAARR